MFTCIMIYRDAIEDIFPKPIAKMFGTAKVIVVQRVIQCTYGDSCKRGSAIRLVLKINSRNSIIVAS